MISKLNYRTKRVIIGLVFIMIGMGYLGTQLNLWEFTIFFPAWWTVFLIIPSLLSILEHGIYFWNVFVLGMGAYFLAHGNGWIEFNMTYPIFMGIMCTCFGIRLLFTRRIKWYGYKADGYKD